MAPRRPLALLSAATLLVLLPSALGQVGIDNPDASTPVTLYMHLIDTQDFPINTQPPDPAWTQETVYGMTTSTLSCTPPDPTGATYLREPYHTFYGYSSPSYVEYLIQEGGDPRVHPERGISYDAHLDTAAPFTAYWYLGVKGPLPGPDGLPDPDSVPLPVPNVAVRATLRSGDDITVHDRGYNTGEVLAQGQSAPATLLMDQVLPGTGGAPPVETRALGQHGGKWLFEVAVPLAIEKPVIPRATGYNLRMDVFMDNPACTAGPDAALMPNLVALHSSDAFRPRLELAVTNPLRITTLHPQFVGDDLVIHTSMNSAWGNYDVNEQDPDGIQVTVTGPSPATSLAKAAIVQRTHEHYHHQEAVDITYVWPYKTDRAQNGLYTVDVKFMNDQRTATAQGIAQFEIGKGTVIGCGGVQEAAEAVNDECAAQVQKDGKADSKGSPGVGTLALVGALALAAVVLRRRKA